MADLLVVVGVIAFFAIAALFVAACDRIIGPDPTPVVDSANSGDTAESEHAAGAVDTIETSA